MEYKLAKELKDVGYKLEKADYLKYANIVDTTIPNELPSKGLIVINHMLYKIPTLSELIGACGDTMYTVSKTEDKRFFVVFQEDDGHGNKIDFWLPSLEDVFAMRYIDLNKN